MIDPQDLDVRLDLRGQVQADGFVGPEVRGDERSALGKLQRPADDFRGGAALK